MGGVHRFAAGEYIQIWYILESHDSKPPDIHHGVDGCWIMIPKGLVCGWGEFDPNYDTCSGYIGGDSWNTQNPKIQL